MKSLLFIILTFAIVTIQAQTDTLKKVQIGVELDVLPYITGGYFAGGWVGKDVWRVRALTAFVNKPDWSTKKGFSNHQIEAYAVVVDRFLNKNWKGWWAGGGIVFWKSTIQTEAKIETAKFQTFLLNGSLGYNFSLGKRLYLSPWAGLNFTIAGDKNVLVDTKTYVLPTINPEASLKFGYIF